MKRRLHNWPGRCSLRSNSASITDADIQQGRSRFFFRRRRLRPGVDAG